MGRGKEAGVQRAQDRKAAAKMTEQPMLIKLSNFFPPTHPRWIAPS